MEYDVIVRRAPGGWVVEVPDLPDVTARGADTEEALSNAVDAIRLHLFNQGGSAQAPVAIGRLTLEE